MLKTKTDGMARRKNLKIIAEDFIVSFKIGRKSTMKISKDLEVLNNKTKKLHLTDSYRIFPITVECTFFSNAHGSSTQMDHSLRP